MAWKSVSCPTIRRESVLLCTGDLELRDKVFRVPGGMLAGKGVVESLLSMLSRIRAGPIRQPQRPPSIRYGARSMFSMPPAMAASLVASTFSFVSPNYVFATRGAQASIDLGALFGRNTTSLLKLVTGHSGALLSGSRNESVRIDDLNSDNGAAQSLARHDPRGRKITGTHELLVDQPGYHTLRDSLGARR